MRLFFGILLAIFLCLASTTSYGQEAPICGERAEVVQTLEEKYQEVPVALALANSGSVVELFTSPNGATWTLTVTTPLGKTCLIGAGEAWTRLVPVVRGEDS